MDGNLTKQTQPVDLGKSAPAPVRFSQDLSSKSLAKMKASPKSGWKISDIEAVCNQLEMVCKPPTRGSHYKASSPFIQGILTIPHNKPIKPVYIRSFIALAEAHILASRKAENKK